MKLQKAEKKPYPCNCVTLFRRDLYDMSPGWNQITFLTLTEARVVEELKEQVRVLSNALGDLRVCRSQFLNHRL
jgi:hypothetical protein